MRSEAKIRQYTGMKNLSFGHAPLHRHPWFFHPMITVKQLKLLNLKFVLFIEENKKKLEKKRTTMRGEGDRKYVIGSW